MTIQIVSGFKDHFEPLVIKASNQLKIKMLPVIHDYLVNLLESHGQINRLYPEPKKNLTLAELWLQAQSTEDSYEQKILLKSLGDKTLYLGGYFSESLQKKLVDIDYYISMGQSAFDHLSNLDPQPNQKRMYSLLSSKFPQWIEIIQFVSLQNLSTSDKGILRLYEHYLKTGSELARTQLVERGVVALSQDQLKKANQDE
jgi:hypothetical protein